MRWPPGKLPFRGETSAVIFNAILERAPVPPAHLYPDVSIELVRTIHKALEKDRTLRYQTAAEFRADLQRLKTGATSHQVAVASAQCSSVAYRKGFLQKT